MINKKNIPLYIALAVPVLMIVLVAAFIYLPNIGKHPQYNFLYETGDNVNYYDSYYSNGYVVANSHVVDAPKPSVTPAPGYPVPSTPPGTAYLYEYNVKTNIATQLSLADAQKLNLDSSTISQDGYTVTQGNYSGGGDFFFGGNGGSDYNSWFIKGNNKSTKLNIKFSGSSNYYNLKFLGWIE